jgi:hypothetical protein
MLIRIEMVLKFENELTEPGCLPLALFKSQKNFENAFKLPFFSGFCCF